MEMEFKAKYLKYSEVSEEERSSVPNNEYSTTFLKVTLGDKVLALKSDEMEPEDASFRRDLNWVAELLEEVFKVGVLEGQKGERNG